MASASNPGPIRSLMVSIKERSRLVPVLGDPTLRRSAKHGVRRLAETLGSDRFSRLSYEGIEDLLTLYLPFRDGFFIEAGAHDGETYSNTYWLERFRGWRGLLVEASPDLAARCRRWRPASRVVQCALVGPERDGHPVTFTQLDLVGTIEGAFGSGELEEAHLRCGDQTQARSRRASFMVPGRTLTSALDDEPPSRVDLLVLDVEGAEPEVLRGLDLSRYRPSVVLVEVLDEAMLPGIARLLPGYHDRGRVTKLDHLFTDARAMPPSLEQGRE